MKTFKFDPDYRIAPSVTLTEVIQHRADSTPDFCHKYGVDMIIIENVLAGFLITEDIALELEKCTGISRFVWMNLDAQYRKPLTDFTEED